MVECFVALLAMIHFMHSPEEKIKVLDCASPALARTQSFVQ